MKEQVLKQMMSAVDEVMRYDSSKGDFYRYDLKTLVNLDVATPFLWSVRKSATTLLTVELADEMKQAENEQYRFQFVHNPMLWVENFCKVLQWGGRVFYYNGETLTETTPEKACEYARDIFTPIFAKIKEHITNFYAAQDGDYNREVEVEICRGARGEIMRIMRSDEGAKFKEILKRFRSIERRAANHTISIQKDNEEKTFTFYDNVNKINGGIVYNGGHWTIHT